MLNAKILLLAVGIIVGGAAGWLIETPVRHQPPAIDLTGLGLELPELDTTPANESFDFTRLLRAAAVAVIGGGSGLAFGYLLDRDRRRRRRTG
jgi:hypothetical protein